MCVLNMGHKDWQFSEALVFCSKHLCQKTQPVPSSQGWFLLEKSHSSGLPWWASTLIVSQYFRAGDVAVASHFLKCRTSDARMAVTVGGR